MTHHIINLVLHLVIKLFPILATTSDAAAIDYNRYACVVDAGSTGSRIHVYKYTNSNKKDALLISVDLDENYKKFHPGLSDFEKYHTDTTKIAQYWSPILEFAREHVPSGQRTFTPLFVLASAGMRKVRGRNPQIADSIITNTYNYLLQSEFIILKNGIKIVEGTDEGVWGWIAANYLNGQLFQLLSSKQKHRDTGDATTKGILEMGGESLQITFILPDSMLHSPSISNSNYITTIKISDIPLNIFSYSWMGIGMQATQSKFDDYIQTKKVNVNPCYLKTQKDNTKQGQFEGCYLMLKSMITDSKQQCKATNPKPLTDSMICTPNDLLMPSISNNNENEFYFIENFFYTARDLALSEEQMRGFNGNYVGTLTEKGKAFCVMTEEQAKKEYPKLSADDIDETCFATCYILAILDTGFELSDYTNYRVLRDINGVGIDWVLGYLVMIIPSIDLTQNVLGAQNGYFSDYMNYMFLIVLCGIVFSCYRWNVYISSLLLKLRLFLNGGQLYSRLRTIQ